LDNYVIILYILEKQRLADEEKKKRDAEFRLKEAELMQKESELLEQEMARKELFMKVPLPLTPPLHLMIFYILYYIVF